MVYAEDAMALESPWDEAELSTNSNGHTADVEWNRMSSNFSTAGYREGLSAGKESSALQEGFDEAFAQVGVPLGRSLGNLRGKSSALISFLNSPIVRDLITDKHTDIESYIAEVRTISNKLNSLTFADIVPRDIEAEDHARQHLEEEMSTGKWAETEEHARKHLNTTDPTQMEIMSERRIREGIQDILSKMTSGKDVMPSAGSDAVKKDLEEMEKRLDEILDSIGLSLRPNRS